MIQTNWLDEGSGIRYWQFGARWTWEEFYAQLQHDIDETELDSKSFDIIFDFSKTRELPPHFLTQMRVSSKRANDNFDPSCF